MMWPNKPPLSFMSARLLWAGCFGFNTGSSLASNGIVTSAFAAAAGVIGRLVAEWIRDRKPSMLGGITGAVAGLVCITPGADLVSPMAALIIGFLGGLICYFAVAVAKAKLGYDDSLDAFGVHGVGGTLDAILTGVFATRAVNDGFDGAPMGLLEGKRGTVR
jgi:Amt family ammonium transporter